MEQGRVVSGVPEAEILELKKTEITDRVKESVGQNGNKPELFGDIVRAAVALLEKLIAKAMQKVMNLAEKVIGKAADTVKEKPRETKKLPQLKPSVLASKYPRLKEIDSRIKEQNEVIFERGKKRLSSIVKEYKFDSVQAFYKELKAAKSEYLDYQADRAKYEKIYGRKTTDSVSIRDRLRQKEQMVEEREAGRVHQTRQKDRGAR